jgi:hypothetical protein
MRIVPNLLLFFAFIFTTIDINAQEQEPAAYVIYDEYNLYHTSKDSIALVFVNMAYVREQPTSKSNLLDSIPLGTKVKFIEEQGLNPTSLRGMHLPWHKIEYITNNQENSGYIWLGLLTLDKIYDQKSGNTFLYGFSWKSNELENEYYWVEAKMLDKNNNLINSKSFPYYPGGQSYTTASLTKDSGIPNSKNIFSVNFHGEACGISSEQNSLSWDGSTFTTLPKTVAVSDAGVFYYSEELLLPNKHKLGKDIILKICEEGEVQEYDDTDPEAELKYTVKKKEETYKWDGKEYAKTMVKEIKN